MANVIGMVVSAFCLSPFFMAKSWSGVAAEIARSSASKFRSLGRVEEMRDRW
jgi:hypothetical protein